MELTKDNFLLYEKECIENVLMKSDLRKRAEGFTDIMQKSRELDIEQSAYELAQSIASEFNEPELWELPETFEKNVFLPSFPINALPIITASQLVSSSILLAS